MHSRIDEFWAGKHATAYVLSDEDMFLLKAVSAGDLGSGRRRDSEDMWIYAQRGLVYESILEEIEKQRPFNTGGTEARHIRDRSHPLFAIEIAVHSLSGLPSSFTNRVEEFGTEFEIKYAILKAIDNDRHNTDAIRNRVLSDVRSLSDDDKAVIAETVDRLIDKYLYETVTHSVSKLRSELPLIKS